MAKPTTYPPQRFRIGHGTRRIMAVGCSHGRFIDDVARVEIPKARDRFKPHYCIHLGDFIDTAGAGG